MAEYEPQVTIGKQVRRADGVLMEEVITTTFDGQKYYTKSNYRPGMSKEWFWLIKRSCSPGSIFSFFPL
jgi:hypothetical protein